MASKVINILYGGFSTQLKICEVIENTHNLKIFNTSNFPWTTYITNEQINKIKTVQNGMYQYGKK